MTKKDIFTGLALLVVLLVGVNFPLNGQTITEKVIERVGAIPGNSVDSEEFTVNGLTTVNKSSALYTSTTTVCVFKSPAATSTLTFASILFNTSSTTASQGLWSKGSSMGASTTALSGTRVFAANEQALVFASTTDITDATRSRLEIAPSQFVKYSMQSTDAVGTFSPTGSCKVQFVTAK